MAMNVQFDEVFENVMMNAVIAACEGNGVLDGLTVSERGAGANMSVDVAAGNCMIDDTKYTESSTVNLSISAADATYDRKDLVTYDSNTSNPIVTTGTAAATPEPPDIPSGNILLAIVDVAAGATQITNADITDGSVVVSESSVTKSLFDAYSILYADTDNNPAALTIDPSRFVGRKASGGVAAMTAAEAEAILTGVFLKDGSRTATGGFDMGTHDIINIAELVLTDAASMTINSSGYLLNVDRSYIKVDTYGGAATDDLTHILPATNGKILILRASTNGHTVVVKNGTGNIHLSGSDFSLDDTLDHLMLIATGDMGWIELSRSNNG